MRQTQARGKIFRSDSYVRNLVSAFALGFCISLAPLSAPAYASSETFRLVVAEVASDNPAISGFYQARNYQTLWTGADDAARRSALFRALDGAALHGLPVGRYDPQGLRAAFAAVDSEHKRAKLEIQVTKAFLAYANDVQSGFLIPEDVDSGIVREVLRAEPRALLDGLVKTDPASFLRSLPPNEPQYAQLQKARLDLLRAIDAGGWGGKVAAKRIDIGDTGADVVALRNRLVAQGYLGRSATQTFDGSIQRAVQMFQVDHGLTPDGVAGEGTIAEINVGPQDRLQSVLVAMERMRWMNGLPLGRRHVWVNLPDFTAKVMDNGKVTFETVTVVGMNQSDRRSPEFSDQIEFMVINPTWNVPRSITVKEYLPMLQRNPNAVRHLKIVDRKGRVVDRGAVDFTQFSAGNFPFSMSQAPSTRNALGLVKFMFPNRWNIYLHDTPQKPLFEKEVRAFSHGCIRLGRPFDLAYTLLAAQTSDPKGVFHSNLDTGRESVVNLEKPVPVHIVYFTAWPNATGHIDFRRDVYGRDGRIFAAMLAAGLALPGVQG
ncbi:MAG: L,D-transpeptidase family protein [Albidovulum sp.]